MMTKKDKAKYIFEEFKFRFNEKSDCELYLLAKDALRLFRVRVDTSKEERHLKNFAKEYYKFRSSIINTRNDLVEYKQSQQYKKDKFINKIRFNRELKKYYKLCDSICEFEEIFYNEMGFSILKVENERWVEEKIKEEQNVVRYLN